MSTTYNTINHATKHEPTMIADLFLHFGTERNDLPSFYLGRFTSIFLRLYAYLEYQRILNVDWYKVQAISQNGIDWVADALTHVSGILALAIRNAIKYWDSVSI